MSARRLVATAGLLVGAAVIAGCLPQAVTAEGREIANLYGIFIVLAVMVGVLVFGLATFAIVRYRGREDGPLPVQTHGNLKLEAIWTAIPVITVLVLFALTLGVLGRTEARSERAGAEVRVEGFRWGWTFSYPAEGVSVSGAGAPGPEIVVPVGEPVRITLTAADVNHAFFVPQFLFKRDAIPGRENVFEITIDQPGTYGGQCAEFCGIYHSRMPFRLRAEPRTAYEAWLADQPRGGAEESAPLGSPLASDPGASPGPSEEGQPVESGR